MYVGVLRRSLHFLLARSQVFEIWYKWNLNGFWFSRKLKPWSQKDDLHLKKLDDAIRGSLVKSCTVGVKVEKNAVVHFYTLNHIESDAKTEERMLKDSNILAFSVAQG